MIKVFIFVVGLITGAYFNTAVLEMASLCCSAAGQGIMVLGRQIVQLAS
jgi:hypothetical protein